MDLKQICRTCLQTNKQRFDIYTSYYTEDNILYADMLCNYTKLKPREDDGYPRLICKDCVKQLKRAHLFNKQCEDSDEKLRNYIDSKEFTVVDVQNEHFSESKTEDDSSYNDDNDDKFLVSLLDKRTEGSYKKEVKTEPIAVDNEDNEMYWESENMILKEVKSKEIPDSEMCQLPGPSRESSGEEKVSDSNQSESDGDDDEGAPRKKRTRTKLWLYLKKFSSLKDAEDFVKAEETWGRTHTRTTTEGQKRHYRCNKVKKRGAQCAAELSLLCLCDSDEVVLYRKYADHDHDDIGARNRYGLHEPTKSRIDKLFDMNLKPKDILDSLKHTDGIELPSKIQLYNYLASKKRLAYNNLAPHTLSKLAKWILGRESVPADENEPFVMKHQLIDQDQDGQPMFRFALTTKRLLKLACSVDVLHAQSASELTWHGFPILTVGMSDRDKKFFPLCLAVATDEHREVFELIFGGLKETVDKLFERDWRPRVLVSDGTRAIAEAFTNVFGPDAGVRVCWSQIRRNIEKKLEETVKKSARSPILQDVDYLHKACSAAVFDAASRAFIEKYAQYEEFVEYFERTCVSGNRNWFLGAAPLSPVTNEALEALNKSVKDQNTSRGKLPLSRFVIKVGETVGEWSTRTGAVCSERTKIQLADWSEGIRWAKEDVPTKVLSSDPTTTTYLVSNRNDSSNLDDDGFWETFDEYKERFFASSTITLVKSEWKKSRCTCPKYFEKYVCKHILGLAIRLKLVTPPVIIPISQLKPGVFGLKTDKRP